MTKHSQRNWYRVVATHESYHRRCHAGWYRAHDSGSALGLAEGLWAGWKLSIANVVKPGTVRYALLEANA